MKLAELQAEAQNKYMDLPLEREDGTVIRLRNLVRLGDTARKNAQVLMDSLDNDKGKQIEGTQAFDTLTHQENVLRDLFLLVADDTAAMKKELATWDLPLMMLVLEKWSTETQLGEAESSAG